MNTETKQVRKGRGKAVKPAMFCTSIRLEPEVLNYYRTQYPNTMQAVMRNILKEHMETNKPKQLDLFL